MASPLHKHETSKKMEKKPEAKKPLPEDKGAGVKADDKGAKKDLAEDKGSTAEKKDGDGGDEKKAPEHHERHQSERKAMHARHESEHRDHENNHREGMRQMSTRHLKDHAEMNKRHMAEMAAASQQAGGEVQGQEPMAAQAPGGGAQSPAAA